MVVSASTSEMFVVDDRNFAKFPSAQGLNADTKYGNCYMFGISLAAVRAYASIKCAFKKRIGR